MTLNKVLYVGFLSFMYFMTVRLFAIYGLISEYTLLGGSYQSIFAFYLTYFLFIAVYYSDIINSMTLIRYKTYSKALNGILKYLFKNNLLFTTIYTIVIMTNIYSIKAQINLLYTIKFYILINICLLLISFFIIVLHLLFNSKMAMIGAILYFLIASLFVSANGTVNFYSPIYLFLAPMSSIIEDIKIVSVILFYFGLILTIFWGVRKVRKIN